MRADNVERMRSYGVTETVDHTVGQLPELVKRTHPDGVDVLVDSANDAEGFGALNGFVRRGAMALTTRYAADQDELKARGIAPLNFQLQPSVELLGRVGHALSTGRIVAPPINRITLSQAPALFAERNAAPDGKTVIVL